MPGLLSQGWRHPLVSALLLAVVGGVLYWPALHAPWYLDDIPAIVENSRIRDLWPTLQGLFGRRGLAMASFAVNYRLGGLDPFGYHLVNLVFHLTSSWLVFLLLHRVLRETSPAPLLGALLFLVHPLQTQPVNYIVQRMTLLSGGLFLLAIYLFTRAREELAQEGRLTAPAHLGWYLGALAAGGLAVLAKENAVVLPLALLLFWRFFLPWDGNWRASLAYLLPFALVPVTVTVLYVILPLAGGRQLVELTAVDRISSQGDITPLTYLVTQFSVLWVYLRLLFLPYGQALDHSYPLATQILTLRSLLALSGLLILAGAAWQLRRRAPLVAFGLVWFFLTLAVESTILPLDPLFEHRLYLPMFGFTIAIFGLCQGLAVPSRNRLLLVVLGVLAVLSWQRNGLWAEPLALHEDNLRKVPHSERVMVNLALTAMNSGQMARAEALLHEAIRLNPRHYTHYINLSRLFIDQHRYQEALIALEKGLAINPASAKLHSNLGGLYSRLGDPPRAIDHLNRALAIDPVHEPALVNLGVVYGGLGLWPKAEAYHRQAIALFADDPTAHYNLGLALEKQGRLAEAAGAYRTSLALKPTAPDPLFRLALVSLWLGERGTAGALQERLQKLDPERAARLAREIYGGNRGQ